METQDLINYLAGGSTFRERVLGDAEDLIKAIKSSSKSDAIAQGLVNPLKNEMLARAAAAKAVMGSLG
jgi:hypothetical protein